MQVNHPIIIYDGYCNLCNGAVNFVIKHDRKSKFRFASLQSEQGMSILSGHSINKQNTDSIVYVDEKGIYLRSTAVFRILKKLGGGWQLLYAFIIIPPCLRDPLYDLVARHRHRWFGRKDHCPILPDEIQAQ